jgi:Ni/Co efflux regulator RcnB
MTKRAARIPGRPGRVASHLLLVLAVSAFAATGAIAGAPDAAQQQQPQQQKQKQQTKTNQQQAKQADKQAKTNQQQQKQADKQQMKANQQQQKQVDKQQKQALQQEKHFDWNTYHPGQRPPLWAQYRQNFDPKPYQWTRNAPRQYPVTYAPPPGWHYQAWNYGQVLPPSYWNQSSWLNNYSQYGLQQPPYGYVWVQNGDDALSVDSYSGTILQVVRGLFSSGSSGLSALPGLSGLTGLSGL